MFVSCVELQPVLEGCRSYPDIAVAKQRAALLEDLSMTKKNEKE